MWLWCNPYQYLPFLSVLNPHSSISPLPLPSLVHIYSLPQWLWSLTSGNTHSIIHGLIFHLNTCTVALHRETCYMIYPPTYSCAVSNAGAYLFLSNMYTYMYTYYTCTLSSPLIQMGRGFSSILSIFPAQGEVVVIPSCSRNICIQL